MYDNTQMSRLLDPVKALSTLPLQERIRALLVDRIGRDWAVGQQVPALSQLCRELGTGRSNTWRAVRQLVMEGVLDSRHGRGTYVRRLPSPDEQSPRRPLTDKRVELLLFSPQPEGFVLRMMESFETRLHEAGCSVARVTVPIEECSRLDQRPADALAIFNPSDHHHIVIGAGQALVAVNTALETPIAVPGRFDVVSVDQEQGGFLAGEHLRRIGCKSVCFMGRSGNRRLETMAQTCLARLRGFERGWGEPLPMDRIIVAKSYSVIRAAQELPRWLAMNPRPDGIFAATDEMALGVVIAASSHGLVPGRDFQIVGFDGQQRGRDLPDHPLTTVDVPTREMGRRAAELLCDRLAWPDRPVRRLFLGCSLFEGATARRTT